MASADLYDPGLPVVISTTTALTATPNASTGGQLVTFTATVAPSPGNLGSVTFRDNGVIIAANIPVLGGVATFQISTMAAGNHPISASYSGTTEFAASTSATLNYSVAVSAPAPQVVSVTVNGNISGLAGPQRSRVASLQVVFDQAVQLDASAFALALHTNNVTSGGVPQPTGLGSLPTTLNFSSTDNTTWIVTFSGNTDPASPDFPAPADGHNSLKDGVYDFAIDATKVHPVGTPEINAIAFPTTVFHRFFGDRNGEEPPAGNAHVAIVATDDNFAFRSSFNRSALQRAYFDFDGNGIINIADDFQFRSRFNKPLSWSV